MSLFYEPFNRYIDPWHKVVCFDHFRWDKPLQTLAVINLTHWVNFRENHLHKHELELTDYNMGKYIRPNVQITGRKIYLSNVCL